MTPKEHSRRVTRPRVKVMDYTARTIITVCGAGVIAAVLGIFVFLLLTVVPLLRSGTIGLETTFVVPMTACPLIVQSDEYRGAGMVVSQDGSIVSFRLDTGVVLWNGDLSGEHAAITAMSDLAEDGTIGIGRSDGTIQIATVGFETRFLTDAADTDRFSSLPEGGRADWRDGYVERTPDGHLRYTYPLIESTDPVRVPQGSGAVVRLDYRVASGIQFAAVMREDGTVVLNTVRRTIPLGGGAPRLRLSSRTVEFRPPPGLPTEPAHLFVTGDGADVLALWEEGACQRYSRDPGGDDRLTLMEEVVLIDPGRRVSIARLLLGDLTVVIGDDLGGVRGVFVARSNTTDTPDGRRLVVAHRFDRHDGVHGAGRRAISAIGLSHRDRTFAYADASGEISVRHMTSNKLVATASHPAGHAPVALRISPKLDGVISVAASGEVSSWTKAAAHPDASLKSLFGRVWYEGEAEPSFVYQSHSGTDRAEAKYSLVPLIFGTLKATVYSMLFAVPIAVLAAIYTSEMLHPKVRSGLKPAIEAMASLPSVVLGFIAAMVLAPLVRDWIAPVLASFVVVPIVVLAAAHAWQLLPIRITAALRTWQHFCMIGVVMMGGFALSVPVGQGFERLFFTPSESEQFVLVGSTKQINRDDLPEWASKLREFSDHDARRLRQEGIFIVSGAPVGPVPDQMLLEQIRESGLDQPDIKRWLDGSIGDAGPGWFLLLTPLALGLTLMGGPIFGGLIGRVPIKPGRSVSSPLEMMIRFGLSIGVGLAIAWGGSLLLTWAGLDPRDSVFGPYMQRNTLVVAVIMGIAVIPIIYTISEDALSSVPMQLRSASLGCGATRWQTAIRVVLPIALSGIFSACMIGLGRAAGETMIVLMATGNTPIMDWSIFSGFRTLAANIAVEMPEAAKQSTHYRVLFLAGLCLFVLTFIVNTTAELLRQRVRRRNAAL